MARYGYKQITMIYVHDVCQQLSTMIIVDTVIDG